MPKQTKSWRKKEVETQLINPVQEEIFFNEMDEIDDIAYKNNDSDEWYWWKSYLDLLRLDLLFFNILKLKHIDENSDYINIKKFITQEDIHAMDLNWKIIEKRIFYNIKLWNLIIKEFDENEIADKTKYENFVKKCRINNLKPDQMMKTLNWKKIIDKEKYLKHFLEIKITKSWLTRIDDINKEIKDMVKNNTRFFKNVKKIQKVIETSPAYLSLAIIIWTFGILSTILFSWNMQTNNNYNTADILQPNWINWFNKVYKEDDNFKAFENYFKNQYPKEFEKISNLRWNSYVKQESDNIFIYKVKLSNQEYLYFKLDTSNWINIENIWNY